jgi:hypothetical protein
MIYSCPDIFEKDVKSDDIYIIGLSGKTRAFHILLHIYIYNLSVKL